MARIFGILIAVLFLSVGHTASAQGILLRALASMGNASAQYNLGYAYYIGEGVERDYAEALKWWRLSAEQGDSAAQDAIGGAYDYGNGVVQDSVEAVKWRRLAAEQGNPYGQYNLAFHYYFGEGVEQDYVYALMWMIIAVSLEHPSAIFERDYWSREMTDEQIAEAQKMARECERKEYKDC